MKKFRYKLILVVAMMLVITTVLAACGGGPIPMPVPKVKGVEIYDIEGSCELTRSGDTFEVTGDTNIASGAVLYISLHAQSGMELDAVKITKTEDAVSQTFQITDEKYDDSVAQVYAYITCAPTLYGKHAESIYDKYGDDFENTEADEDNVIWNNDGIIFVFASDPIDM